MARGPMLGRRRFAAATAALLAGATAAATHAAAAEDALAADLARIEAGSGGRMGVAVLDTRTGRRHGHRARERFPMCSTSKVLSCAALLARVDAGRDDLERRILYRPSDLVAYSPVTTAHAGRDGMTLAALCEAAITLSDNTAANLILARIGGPSGVTAFARGLGDPVTRLDRAETALNEATPGDPRDTTAPEAMAANLQALVLGARLSASSRERLTGWLLGCRTGGGKLRAGLPAGWRIGDKTGSGGHGSSNDVAVIWPPGRKPLIACVYLTETTAVLPARDACIADVGRAVTRLAQA